MKARGYVIAANVVDAAVTKASII